MNREVELAAKRKGYVPYMVRMQLATMPYRRHLPYDIHAQVEFFPASDTFSIRKADKDTRLPYVVPILVTDDLEQSIKSRAAEVARQIGLAVNLMVHGVGGNVGANAESRNRESVLAADFNSLLTVARLNDNGIYIRLGAANEATAGYSLVGRTYDITLLLLVPCGYFETSAESADAGSSGSDDLSPRFLGLNRMNLDVNSKPGLQQTNTPQSVASEKRVILSVITHTDFRDATSGALLKERRDTTLVDQVDSAFERTLRIGNSGMYETWSHKTQDDKLTIARKLIAAIQTSNYAMFYDVANSITLHPHVKEQAESGPLSGRCTIRKGALEPRPEDNGYRLACISEGYLRSLWSYLASAMVESSTKSASVELPVPPDVVIPKQNALMLDDGKEKLNIVLSDVSGVTPGGISAKLLLTNSDDNSYEFPAEIITPDPAAGTLALQFPSTAKWKIGKIDLKKSHLSVNPRPCTFGRACASDKMKDHSFAVQFVELSDNKSSSDKAKPGFNLRSSVDRVNVNKGAGTVKLVFDDFKDDSADLTWSGAQVNSAKDSDGNSIKLALDKITVKAATTLTLEIQNANPDVKITFTAVGNKAGKKTGEVAKEFSVVAGK